VSCHSGATITGISVVNDSGWMYPAGITVLVDNITINGDVITFDESTASVPTTKDDCKGSGWKDKVDGQGNSFKNQGDCVSFIATKGKNGGAVRAQ
jgi:hypothetical protein